MSARKLFGLVATAAVFNGCNDVEFAGNGADQRNPKIVVDREFAAAALGAESLKVAPPYGQMTQRLALLEKPLGVFTDRQITRAVKVDAFEQGHDGAPANEEFDVSGLGKVDLLLVIDNSGSMADEQEDIATRLRELTANLESTDWQIAVVTTDSSRLRLDKVIKKGKTPEEKIQNDKDFEDVMNAGKNGSGDETGIYYAYRALQGVCETRSDLAERGCNGYVDPKWIRQDAALGVLMISDEESMCDDDDDCKPEETGKGLVDLMVALKGGDKTRVRGYAIFWDRDTDKECRNRNGENKGTRYREFVDAAKLTGGGGLEDSICKHKIPGTNDEEYPFAETLKKISKDVARSVKREFELKFAPDAKSLALTLDGAPFTDFEIVQKKIKLKAVADTALKLAVNYRYDSKPKFDRFQLSLPAAIETIDAFVDDVPVDDAKVQYDEATQEVFFVDMPADSAAIKVKFRDGSAALRTQYEAPASEMAGGPLEVSVGGVSLDADAWSFDATTGVVTLAAAPADGAEVTISFKVQGAAILSYAAAPLAAELRHDVTAADAATGEALEVSLQDGLLWFEAGAVQAGREIDVLYDFGNSADLNSVELAHDPTEGSVEVTAAGPDGTDCIDRTSVEGRKVQFGCSADLMTEARITYQYVVETKNRFEVPEAPTGAGTHWQVFVDGAAVSFEREGKAVVVSPSLLKLDSKVRILVTNLE